MPKYPQATPTSGTPNANGPGPATIPRPPKLPETIVTDDPLKR